jgi:diphosphate--fructose-6-phosphate 1-phosphotransferase
VKFAETIKGLFPTTNSVPKCTLGSGISIPTGKGLKVGVVLSGGQAPGGHNVIAGLYDAVKRTGQDFLFYGFNDGPHGIFSGNVTKIDDAMMDGYRNTGGFDMIGSGRHKIETEEQFEASRSVCLQLELDGLVVIGGDDSNTNAALLAENFQANGCKTKVIGCPKTIDGDLKCPPDLPVSFGFDTACRTYAELVGNLAVDALSTQKY